jgi:death-on-curing protein
VTEPVWLLASLILKIHEEQLRRHGGGVGIRDEGLLDSALARPLNAYSYGVSDICELGALYATGIIKNHPFVDGNKRTGYIAGRLFIETNGLRLVAPQEERLAYILMLAAGDIDETAYADWLKANTEAL